MLISHLSYNLPMKRNTGFIFSDSLLVFFNACASSTQPNAKLSHPAQHLIFENKGSDTLVNLALAWAEKYQNDHPDIQISVTGGGTGTGFTALINGTIDIANASRGKSKPRRSNEAKENGFEPVEFIVANDAIAVIVNPSNPVSQLTLEQVSRIYQGMITNWQEAGRRGPADRAPLARNQFRDACLFSGNGHPAGQFQEDKSTFFRGYPAAAIIGRASSPKCATIPTPSATMGWDM